MALQVSAICCCDCTTPTFLCAKLWWFISSTNTVLFFISCHIEQFLSVEIFIFICFELSVVFSFFSLG